MRSPRDGRQLLPLTREPRQVMPNMSAHVYLIILGHTAAAQMLAAPQKAT